MAAPYRGKPLLEHAITAVGGVCREVVIVLAPGAPAPGLWPGVSFRLARDAREGEGPLAGLLAGLGDVTTDLALVVGGDMPALSTAVLAEMIRVAEEAAVDAVALAEGDTFRPLPCVLRSRAREAAARLYAAGERSLRALLLALRVTVIEEPTWRGLDPEGGTLLDIDRPEDLQS